MVDRRKRCLVTFGAGFYKSHGEAFVIWFGGCSQGEWNGMYHLSCCLNSTEVTLGEI